MFFFFRPPLYPRRAVIVVDTPQLLFRSPFFYSPPNPHSSPVRRGARRKRYNGTSQ